MKAALNHIEVVFVQMLQFGYTCLMIISNFAIVYEEYDDMMNLFLIKELFVGLNCSISIELPLSALGGTVT